MSAAASKVRVIRIPVGARLSLVGLLLIAGACRGRSILERAPTGDGGVDASGTDAGGESCTTGCLNPPAPVCLDKDRARHFSRPGACVANACAYQVTEVTCDKGCEAGFCRENPCRGVKCDVPPSACLQGGVCDRGQCNWTAAPSGGACDDRNGCTVGEQCDGKGVCQGQPQVCKTPPALACASATTAVVHDPIGLCGAGACAYVSRTVTCPGGCANGVCLGDPCGGVMCNQPPGSCYGANGTCSAGQCHYLPSPDGNPCSDGNACSSGDTCQAGLCRSGAAVVCSDGDVCTADSCDPAVGCVHPIRPNGFPCNDQNSCTSTDVCRDRACHGETLACDDDNGCTVDTCDLKTGGCQHLAIPDGMACTDGSVCTSGDLCTGGACVGNSEGCDDKNPCTSETCDPNRGCVFAPLSNGTACTDHNSCTRNDQCTAGVCTGTGLSCDDGNTCTKDNCNPNKQVCEHHPLGQGFKCDDKSACTVDDRCGPVAQCAGSTVSCDDGNPCTAEACDSVNGCAHGRVANGVACDDGDSCTSASSCLAGICLGTMGLSCDDQDPCTVDRCDLVQGSCAHVPAPDGSVCGGPAGCRAGLCTAGQCVNNMSPSCDDGNPCTTDACGADGACLNAAMADGALCSDGNACTTGDRCVAATCRPLANNCDDGDPCTVDACGPNGACTHNPIPNGGLCEDGNACTIGETCTAGACAGGLPRGCDDNNSCTADLCDPASGCRQVAAVDGTACNDGDLCTEIDRCGNGSCVGSRVDCGTNDKCLSGSCDPTKGCVFQAAVDGTSCNDGDKCTSGDACLVGKCTGAGKMCDDGNPCTTDDCAPLNGSCVNLPAPAGTVCNDGNPCTMADQCQAATCLGTPINDRSVCQAGAVSGCCVTGLCCDQPGCCL